MAQRGGPAEEPAGGDAKLLVYLSVRPDPEGPGHLFYGTGAELQKYKKRKLLHDPIGRGEAH